MIFSVSCVLDEDHGIGRCNETEDQRRRAEEEDAGLSVCLIGSDRPHVAMTQQRSADTSFRHLLIIAEHGWTVLAVSVVLGQRLPSVHDVSLLDWLAVSPYTSIRNEPGGPGQRIRPT